MADDFNKSGFRKGKNGPGKRIPGTESKDAIKKGSKPSESISSAGKSGPSLNGTDYSAPKARETEVNLKPGQNSDNVKSYSDSSEIKQYGDNTPKQYGSSTGQKPSEKIVTKSSAEQVEGRMAEAFKEGQKIREAKDGQVKTNPSDVSEFRNFMETSNHDEENEVDLELDKANALSLRYRIPKKLAKLSKEDPECLKKLAKWTIKQLDANERDREQFMEERLPQYRDIVSNFYASGLQEVFEGQHNIHIPLAFEKCRAMHARIYQAVLGVDPIFSLKPRSAVSAAAKDSKEQLLNFVLKSYANYRTGVYEVVDADIWNFVSDGTAVTRHYWKKDVRKFHGIDLEINRQGEEVEKEVEKEEVIFDGPMMQTVPLEDFYMVGNEHGDADCYDIIAEMQRYTKSDLVSHSRLGFFMEEAVEHVLERVTPTRDEDNRADSDIHNNVKEQNTGIRQTYRESGRKTFNVVEAYVKYDIDDDGIDEELVVWIEKSSKTVLRITYLERVGPAGKRPYVIKRFMSREGSAFGVGLGEMLFGINNEVDYLHNMRLDSAVFNILPMFKYRRTGSVGKEKVKMRVGPGKLIGVDDMDDLQPIITKNNVQLTYQEEQNLNKTAEGISISALSMGQISGQGATRTATGTAALVAAADALLDISIKRYQQGFKKNLEIIDKQLIDLLPKGTLIRIVGIDGIEYTKMFSDREAFRFDVDFELETNSATSNKAVEREITSLVYQNSLNPVLIQLGVVGPEQVRNAYIDYLKANDRKNFQRYVAGPEEALFTTKTAKDELTMILMGIKPDVVLNDKHLEKLAFFEEFENSPDGFGMFTTEDQVQLYSETKQAHQNFASAMAAQANQVAQSGFIAPQQTAAVAAGAGNPSGQVPNQISDLAGEALGSNQ